MLKEKYFGDKKFYSRIASIAIPIIIAPVNIITYFFSFSIIFLKSPKKIFM